MEFKAIRPMYGFEDIRLFELEKIDEVFLKLSSKEGRAITFTLINPYSIRNDYEFEIDDELTEKLELANSKNILIANVVVLAKPVEKSRINFLAPIIFNFDNKKFAQIILDNRIYQNYGLLEPLKKYIGDS